MITQRKKAVLALWKLYKAMSNTVDSLIINREDIPSADQWINDLASDMKVVKEWISALSDTYSIVWCPDLRLNHWRRNL